jgi:hypothetical protein
VRLWRVVPTAVLVASSALVGAHSLAAAATNAPMQGDTCVGGIIPAGTYQTLVIAGVCAIPSGQVHDLTDLVLEPNSILDDVTSATKNGLPGDVYVDGSVYVQQGATLALGCSPSLCVKSTNGTIGGALIADNALSVIVHGETINQGVSITGGGGGVTCKVPAAYKAYKPLKKTPAYTDLENNTIFGDVHVLGVQSCWMGALRNQVDGDMDVANNTMADPDAMEVVGNWINGDLDCAVNSPAIQFGDSKAAPNIVTGRALGQCAAPISEQ